MVVCVCCRDLSQTSIAKLPTVGLSESLEILRITDTFTMKEIPFIYNFKRMKEAHLTYPYHCCAFRFPANHNPVEYEKIKTLFHGDRFDAHFSPNEPITTAMSFLRTHAQILHQEQ